MTAGLDFIALVVVLQMHIMQQALLKVFMNMVANCLEKEWNAQSWLKFQRKMINE